MSFLDNTLFSTDIRFTKYARDNNKTINDIVKFTIDDNDIDYNLTSDQIKDLSFLESSNQEVLDYPLRHNNNIISELLFNLNIDTNGTISVDNNIITLNNSNFVEFECTNDSQLFIKITDKIIVTSIFIDNDSILINNNNFSSNYFHFDKKIKVVFDNNIKNTKIVFYSVKHNLYKEYIIYN